MGERATLLRATSMALLLYALVKPTGAMAQEPTPAGDLKAADPSNLDGRIVREAWIAELTSPASWSTGELGSQAKRLTERWDELGQSYRTRPRFVEQGESSLLILPPRLLNLTQDDCVTVAVLGTQNLSFMLVFDRSNPGAEAAWPVPSSAGLAQVTRCGRHKAALRQLQLKMRSRRGILESVVVRSKGPPPLASEVLSGRDAGPSLATPHIGPPPDLAPLADRVQHRRQDAAQHGARAQRQSGVPTDSTGRGGMLLHLSVGCHRLDFMAPQDALSPADVDAQLFNLATGALITSDEEPSGQASLRHCVGRDERLRIEVSGAKPNTELVLLHAEWDLPEGIPRAWGAIARARLSQAVWKEALPQLASRPTFSSMGVRGSTSFAIETDPHACYQVAVAPIRGEVETMRLEVGVASDRRTAQSRASGAGTTLSFCARGREQVPLVHWASGSGLSWILGIWQIAEEEGAQ